MHPVSLQPLFRPPPRLQRNTETRWIQLEAQTVSYQLHRERKRLSLVIDERGLRVGAPRAMSLTQIERFICKHGDWVLARLEIQAQRRARRTLTLDHGAHIPYLGGEVALCIVSGTHRSAWTEQGKLLLPLPGAVDAAGLAQLARRALKQQALKLFTERVALYAARMNHPPPPLRLSNARTRWGSCQGSGIRLNWRLIHLPLAQIDYVVTHELAHLVEMNHSPRFWAQVERLYPDWRSARRELKRLGKELPIF